jgi:hypothetical protein
MPIIAVPWNEYEEHRTMRKMWHIILDNPELLEKLPSDTWRGFKLEKLLMSKRVDLTKPGWEEALVKLWSEL